MLDSIDPPPPPRCPFFRMQRKLFYNILAHLPEAKIRDAIWPLVSFWIDSFWIICMDSRFRPPKLKFLKHRFLFSFHIFSKNGVFNWNHNLLSSGKDRHRMHSSKKNIYVRKSVSKMNENSKTIELTNA